MSSDTLCRPSSGPCDANESCTGISAACPADAVLSDVTMCRPSAGVCDPAEQCDGLATLCPPDVNLFCPVGWQQVSVPAKLQGDYCGSLSDGTFLSLTWAENGLYDVFAYAVRNGFVNRARTVLYVENSLFNPQISIGRLVSDNLFGIELRTFDKTSVTVNFKWSLRPGQHGSTTNVLKLNSCSQDWALPANKYCAVGTSNHYVSAVLDISARIGPQNAQTATLNVSPLNWPFAALFQLSFVHYIPTSGQIYFIDNISGTPPFLKQIVYNQTTDQFALLLSSSFLNLNHQTLSLSRCSFKSIPPGKYFADSERTHITVTVENISAATDNGCNVQIELLNNVGATGDLSSIVPTIAPLIVFLAGPFFKAPTLSSTIPEALQSAGLTAIVFNWKTGQFLIDVGPGVVETKSFRCTNPSFAMTSHAMMCGVDSSNTSYSARYKSTSLQVYQYLWPFSLIGVGTPSMYFTNMVGDGNCSRAANITVDSFYAGDMQVSVVQQYATSGTQIGIQTGYTTGPLLLLSAAKCFQPPPGLTLYSGVATFHGGMYYGTLVINGTVDADMYVGLTMKISNSTNVLCTYHGRGMFALGGSVIFAKNPRGSCLFNGRDYITVYTLTLDTNGSFTATILQLTFFLGFSLSMMSTVDPVPNGRYCADLGAGDFVVVQQDDTGTTTIYSSIAGQLSSVSLWTEVLNKGTYVANHSGTMLFPVQLMNFSSGLGYGFVIHSGASMYATGNTCIAQSFAPGKFCGVSRSNVSSLLNTTFSVLTLTWDASTHTYATSLYASRQVASSLSVNNVSLNITFIGLPWLLPFFNPARVIFDAASMTWTIEATDGLGTFSVIMKAASCGIPLPAKSYCGVITNDQQLEVHIDVEGVGNDSMELTVYLLNSTGPIYNKFTFSNAYLIDSELMYLSNTSPPALVLTNLYNDTIDVDLFSGKYLSTVLPCPQVLNPDEYYCGMNGTMPATLTMDFAMSQFSIVLGIGADYKLLTVPFDFPMTLAGNFHLFPLNDPYSVTGLQYFSTNDSFLMNVNYSSQSLIFARGKCSLKLVPDGEYCGYNDTIDELVFKITVTNSTFTTRIPQNHFLLNCLQTHGTLFTCSSTEITVSWNSIDNVLAPYAVDGAGVALLAYSAGAIRASFFLDSYFGGSSSQYLTKSACSNPPIFRSFAAASAVYDTDFSANTRLAVNPSGVVFVADADRHCIFAVEPTIGAVKPFTGRCDTPGYTDGDAVNATLDTPLGLAFDDAGLMYVLDSGNARVRLVTPNGTVTSFSGNGIAASVDGSGDVVSYLDLAGIVRNPASGRLYIAEAYRIRILTQATNVVKTFVGSTSAGFAGGSGVKAQLNRPGKPTFTQDGQTMYFVDSGNFCLRKVTAAGSVVIVASSKPGFLEKGTLPLNLPPSLVDSNGNVLVLYKGQVWIYVSASGQVTRNAGSSANLAISLNATDMTISRSSGSLYVSDFMQLHAFDRSTI